MLFLKSIDTESQCEDEGCTTIRSKLKFVHDMTLGSTFEHFKRWSEQCRTTPLLSYEVRFNILLQVELIAKESDLKVFILN